MRISVNSPGSRSINLRIPTRLLLNPIGALIIPKLMKGNGMTLNYQQALSLIKTLNNYRRKHPEWNFIEASTSDGTSVEIRI